MNRHHFPNVDTSRPHTASAALALSLVIFASACSDGDHRHSMMWNGTGTTPPNPIGAACGVSDPSATDITIDADVHLVAQPGEGAGMFVEYGAGGHWHAYTSCRSASRQEGCTFDIVATAINGAALTQVRGDNLEPLLAADGDVLTQPCPSQVSLSPAHTSIDTDGVWFDAPAGLGVQFTFWAEGVADANAASLVYVSSAGVIRAGIPANPVTFRP